MTKKSRPDGDDPEVILIVEDEILIRMVIADYLRDCGYKVIEAASGDEALVLLQQKDITIDIVFSDIEMPGDTDGFKLSQWLRQHKPDTNVLLAGTPAKAAEMAHDLCEDGPLTKPYDQTVALNRIRRLLAGRRKG
ncbi:MAG: response regulator [Ferrovibrio sp.]